MSQGLGVDFSVGSIARGDMGQYHRRRILLSMGALLCAPFAIGLAQTPQHARVGFLWTGFRKSDPWLPLLSSSLKELGWVEGRNLTVETRYAEGRQERLAAQLLG